MNNCSFCKEPLNPDDIVKVKDGKFFHSNRRSLNSTTCFEKYYNRRGGKRIRYLDTKLMRALSGLVPVNRDLVNNLRLAGFRDEAENLIKIHRMNSKKSKQYEYDEITNRMKNIALIRSTRNGFCYHCFINGIIEHAVTSIKDKPVCEHHLKSLSKEKKNER